VEKEREVLALRANHTHLMESQMRNKDAEILEYRRKLEVLTSDFAHNLRILGERDSLIQRLQKQVKATEQENIEMKRKLEEVLNALASLKAASDQRESDLFKKVTEMKDTIDAMAANAREDRCRLVDEFERERARMRNKMRDVDELLEEQRQELTAMFDRKLSSQDIEFHRQKESLKLSLCDMEAKYNDAVQHLEKAKRKELDNEIYREKLKADADEAKGRLRQVESKFEDAIRLKDSQVLEIESEKSKLQSENSTNVRKISELLQSLHDVEKAFIAYCHRQTQQFEADRRKLNQEKCILQASFEDVKNEIIGSKVEILELQGRIDEMEKSEHANSIKLKSIEHAKTEAKEEVLAVEGEANELKQEREYLKRCIKAKDHEVQLLAKDLDRVKQYTSRLEIEQVRNEKIVNEQKDALMKERTELERRLVEQEQNFGVQMNALNSRIEKMAVRHAVRHAADNGAVGINEQIKYNVFESTEAEPDSIFALLSDHNSPFRDGASKTKNHEMMKSPIKVNDSEDLLRENQQLQFLVSMMRKEMEDLGQRTTGSVDHHPLEASYGNNSPHHGPKHERRQQGSSSEQLALKQQISDLSGAVKSLRRQNKSLKRKAAELEKMNHTSDYSEGLSYLGVRESDQLLSLKEKIGDMTNELEGVISDRNRLQDLSNKLQVELNKSKRDHFRSHNSIETNFPKDQSGNMKFTTVGDVVIRGKPHLRPHTSQGRTTQSQRSALLNIQNKQRRRVQARATERRAKVRNWSILDTDDSSET